MKCFISIARSVVKIVGPAGRRPGPSSFPSMARPRSTIGTVGRMPTVLPMATHPSETGREATTGATTEGRSD